MKKSLIISITFLLIGIGIGITVINWTNAEEENTDTTTEYVTVEDLPEYTGVFDKADTALNYLENGNFYSEGKSYKMVIDTSYVDMVGNAIYWYDKVIAEFPKTKPANRALKDKMKTILGWSEGYGDDKESYGLRDRSKAAIYFPMLEETYTKLETDFPDDTHLQAFAFQIAQRYWFYLLITSDKKYRVPFTKWMNKTIKLADGKDTFYSHIAKQRLRQNAK